MAMWEEGKRWVELIASRQIHAHIHMRRSAPNAARRSEPFWTPERGGAVPGAAPAGHPTHFCVLQCEHSVGVVRQGANAGPRGVQGVL